MKSTSFSHLDLSISTAFKAGQFKAWICKTFKLILLLIDAPEVLLESYSVPNCELYISTAESNYRIYNENKGISGPESWILLDNRNQMKKIKIPTITMHATEIEVGKEFCFDAPSIDAGGIKSNAGKVGIITGILLVDTTNSEDVSNLPEASLYKDFNP